MDLSEIDRGTFPAVQVHWVDRYEICPYALLIPTEHHRLLPLQCLKKENGRKLIKLSRGRTLESLFEENHRTASETLFFKPNDRSQDYLIDFFKTFKTSIGKIAITLPTVTVWIFLQTCGLFRLSPLKFFLNLLNYL